MGPSPHFSASLEDLPLGAYLAPFLNAKRSLALRVEAPWAQGLVQLAGGNLHHAEVRLPQRLEGYRALDYLLGLRRGRVEAQEAHLGRAPTLSGDLLTLRFVLDRQDLWRRARTLPPDWRLRLRLTPKGRAWLRREGKELLALLKGAEGESLAKALARFPALPSAVALALSALAGEGALAFDPPSRLPFRP